MFKKSLLVALSLSISMTITGCYYSEVSYDMASGTFKDNAKAFNYMEQACNRGIMDGCFNLGIMYANGTGVAQDKAKAITFFKQVCDRGDKQGCEVFKQLSH